MSHFRSIKYILVMMITAWGLLICRSVTAYAAESEIAPNPDITSNYDIASNPLLEELETDEINAVIAEIFEEDELDFGALLLSAIKGESVLSFDLIIEKAAETLTSEIVKNKRAIVAIILIAVFAAILSNISAALDSHQIAQVSFFVMTLLLMVLLIKSTMITVEVAGKTVKNLVLFMEVLVPAYLLCIAFTAGATSASAFYGGAMICIVLVEGMLLTVVLPMIQFYMVLIPINHLAGDNLFLQLLRLLKTIIQYILKTAVALVIGINAIQGMVAPVAHSVKTSLLSRAVEVIPGLSGVTDVVMDTVLGSAVIIKNAVGLTAIALIIMIALVPVVKLSIMMFMYQFAAALTGPLSDKGLSSCIAGMGDGAKLLLRTLVTSIFLFLVTIAMMAMATNRGY